VLSFLFPYFYRFEAFLNRFSAGEETAVDCVDDWLSADLFAAEESSVKAFDGVLASLYTVKFKVYVSLRIWI
jgi:hypothetical protein